MTPDALAVIEINAIMLLWLRIQFAWAIKMLPTSLESTYISHQLKIYVN